MNEDAVQELIHRKPELKSHRAKLEAMQPGAYCIHRSWGFGKIREYDAAEGKLVIDFEGKASHKMDPAFCATTLEVLAPDHILVRKETEPEKIKDLIENNPGELVVELLKQYPNHAATGVEVESVLVRVVGDAAFKRWWTKAKKEVARDPRVSSPAKKTECYVLRNEPVSVEDEILEEFNNTRSARRRILLGEKLFDAAEGNEALKNSLPGVLAVVTEAVKDSKQLTPAERLHGAWVRDDLAKFLGTDTAGVEPAIESLVAEARDLPDIAEKLPAHLQSRLLDLTLQSHPTDWKEIVFNLLKTSRGKFTTDCISFLIEHDCGPELAATLGRWQTEQNLRAPVLLWIVKNRNSKRFRSIVAELIAPRLLSSIFFAIDYEALQTAGTRRIPLGEELSDDHELITDLLTSADAETARDLANALLLNQGFEELTKKSLLARFIKHFPSIQNLVSGESADREERLLVSRESMERRQEELRDIITKKIPENSRAIAAAREHGDLRENSEFKMAKQDQLVLFAQRASLEREIGRAQVSEFADASTDQVGVGTVVTVHVEKSGKDSTYTILGAWDGDPEKNIISYKTPLGAALLSHRVGDAVAIRSGDREVSVVVKEIRRYADVVAHA
jgi:transcription elongation factor GreA